MKRVTFLLICIMLLSVNAFSAQINFKKIGIGFALGDPMGFTAKCWTNEENAFQATLGWFDNVNLHLNIDYLKHYFDVISVENEYTIPVYIGCGAFFRDRDKDKQHDDDEFQIGGRFLCGLAFFIDKFEIFLELAPAIKVMPDMDFMFMGGIGFRYYFK